MRYAHTAVHIGSHFLGGEKTWKLQISTNSSGNTTPDGSGRSQRQELDKGDKEKKKKREGVRKRKGDRSEMIEKKIVLASGCGILTLLQVHNPSFHVKSNPSTPRSCTRLWAYPPFCFFTCQTANCFPGPCTVAAALWPGQPKVPTPSECYCALSLGGDKASVWGPPWAARRRPTGC